MILKFLPIKLSFVVRIPGLSDSLSQLNQIGRWVGHVTDVFPHLVPHVFDGVHIRRVCWRGCYLNLLLSEETTCVTRGVASSIVMNQHKIVLERCPCIGNHGIPQNIHILETVKDPIDEHQLGFGTMVIAPQTMTLAVLLSWLTFTQSSSNLSPCLLCTSRRPSWQYRAKRNSSANTQWRQCPTCQFWWSWLHRLRDMWWSRVGARTLAGR